MMKAIALCVLLASSALAQNSVLDPPRHGGIYAAAHRGAHEGIPENTLPAYQKAIDLGMDFVEIDVRTTKDGKFVSMHNDSLDAYTNGARKDKVKDLTLDEIRSVDIGSRIGPEWKDVKVPTFDEILDLCKGKIGIYLDLKNAPVEPLIAAIKARGMERDVIWYAYPDRLEEVKRLCPDCIPMPDPGPVKNLPDLLKRFEPKVVASTEEYFTKDFADQCHKVGAIVIVDEDSPEGWQKLLEAGADGIQTDHPADLIAFLEKRQAPAAK